MRQDMGQDMGQDLGQDRGQDGAKTGAKTSDKTSETWADTSAKAAKRGLSSRGQGGTVGVRQEGQTRLGMPRVKDTPEICGPLRAMPGGSRRPTVAACL
jgi:hypothetical protein